MRNRASAAGRWRKCAGLGIDGRSEKIVRRGVADVEMNYGIEFRYFQQIRFLKMFHPHEEANQTRPLFSVLQWDGGDES